MNSSHKISMSAAVLSLIAIAVGSALTRNPWADEGEVASAPYNLAFHGNTATTVVETATYHFWPGTDRITYWQPPLAMVTVAGWFKLIGFSLLTMRLFSLLWGLIGIAAWYRIVKAITGRQEAAVLCAVLLALDYVYTMASSLGRYDLMSAALGFCGWAAYLELRVKRFPLAVVTSHFLTVASGLSHPIGGIMALLGLVIMTLYYDRRRIRLNMLALAAIPYVVGCAVWAVYIVQDVQLFKGQFINQGSFRLYYLIAPWKGMAAELQQRYIESFVYRAGGTRLLFLKSFMLLGYWGAVVAGLTVRRLRSDPGVRLLLLLVLADFVILSVEGSKQRPYLVHMVPVYVALVSIWLLWLWRESRVPRWFTAGAVLGLVCLHVGLAVYRIRANEFRNTFVPVARYLQPAANQGALIMGPSCMAFGVGFDSHVLEDPLLGFQSGKRADFIVLNDEMKLFVRLWSTSPEKRAYIQSLFERQYRQVLRSGEFEIYARRKDAAAMSGGRPRIVTPAEHAEWRMIVRSVAGLPELRRAGLIHP
jgi:4-amino-4-deoxy-L-arabinose transferase-like glycosyltransferase